MYKLLSTLLLALVFSITVNAQQTAAANLSINLSPVLSIQVLNPDVNFVYNTAESYGLDQTINKVGHIEVISSTEFSLTMKANGIDLISPSGTIPVNVITISLPNAGAFSGTYSGERILSNIDQSLITGAPLGFRKLLDVNYRIPAIKASSV